MDTIRDIKATVCKTILFTLYTSDFSYKSESHHLQKFSDYPAIVGCISGQQEEEYGGLVDDFVWWCRINCLQLYISNAKEHIVDFF